MVGCYPAGLGGVQENLQLCSGQDDRSSRSKTWHMETASFAKVQRIARATCMVLLFILVSTAVSLVAPSQVTAASPPSGALGPLLVEPADGFGSVYSFIAGAKASLEMVMYELDDATAERDLVSDERRGVKVRVILDRAYHGGAFNEGAFTYLSSHGVPVRWAPASTIVHEKAIVVDSRRALIATFNLADVANYYATTRDFGVFDANPADVTAIVRVFDTDWRGEPIEQPPSVDDGNDLVWSPGSEPALAAVIAHAHHTLLVESEEMADASMISDLAAAARRGVDVEVVMTASSSWARSFDELVRAGVRVRTYAYDATPYIHAKVVVADGGLASQLMFVGSENFSYASLAYNRELGLLTRDGRLIAPVARAVRADFAGGRPWTS